MIFRLVVSVYSVMHTTINGQHEQSNISNKYLLILNILLINPRI